jgi:hypothetical protein
MANALQIADALYAEDRDAKTLAQRVAVKLEQDGVTNLPLLTQENYATGRTPPGSLVRYVGMVQDMGNPEFYAPSVAVNGTDVCVAFRDELPSGADPSNATLADRKPFFCVAPPGLTDWASPPKQVVPPPPPSAQATKRPREDTDEQPPQKCGGNAFAYSSTSAAKAVATPTGVLVRVYGDDGPRLNELVEIVGVVGGGLATTGLEVTEEDDAFDRQRLEDEQAWDPPTSKVARLHALSWRRLDPSYPVPPGVLDASTADSIRIALLDRLASALDGDSIGAEYALCALLASVDKRKDGRAVGALSLGLFCDAAHVDRIAQNLSRVFGEVLPRVLTVKTSTASAPLRSPGSERLAMSSLQICDGSALITVVDGQAPASPAAAAATSALRQLYGSQKQIPFNFGFSEVKVPCDVVSVRIGVTDGSIECDVDLPLKLAQQSSLPDLSESTLQIMRQYVAAARRVVVDIDEEGASGLEDQFVAARATGRLPSRDAEGRLHQWVSVSKLKARALGSVNMNPPHYNDAFDLEEERANRLKERMKLMRAMAPPPPRSVQHGFRSGFLSAKEVGLAD